MVVERIPAEGEIDVVRQGDGEVLHGNGNGPARGAMDEGDRASPITLSRHAPIMDSVVDGGFAFSGMLEVFDDVFFCRSCIHSVEEV